MAVTERRTVGVVAAGVMGCGLEWTTDFSMKAAADLAAVTMRMDELWTTDLTMTTATNHLDPRSSSSSTSSGSGSRCGSSSIAKMLRVGVGVGRQGGIGTDMTMETTEMLLTMTLETMRMTEVVSEGLEEVVKGWVTLTVPAT
jgi:hypothetical protein